MKEATFWDTIALFDWRNAGDDDAVLRPALEALAAMSEDEIYGFDDLLAAKLFALDTREHCRHCYAGTLNPDNGDDYISADDFLYSRCVAVANGREFYDDVLRDPSQMPKDLEFEAILSLAPQAYEEKTGDPYEHSTPVSYESFGNEVGWRANANTRDGKFTGADMPPGNRRPT